MHNVFRRLAIHAFSLAGAALATLAMSLPAAAQPAPARSAPKDYVDLGVIDIGGSAVSPDITIVNDQNRWFRFQLTTGISPATWLNIDTAHSTVNTEIGLYNEWGYLIDHDDVSGGGLASALPYGGGSGRRLGEDDEGWPGSRIDVGWTLLQDGSRGWRPTLRGGTYYVCVVGQGADFSQSPIVNWRVSTSFSGSGAVRLRVRTGVVPTTQWNERHRGGEAGSTPDTAQIVTGSGPLETILCSFYHTDRDMFKIRICDPASFRVVAACTNRSGGVYPSILLLFDSDGRGVLGIDNAAGGDTTLSLPQGFSISPGDYYVAVSSRCLGADGFLNVPYDAHDLALWDFSSNSNRNRPIEPNGTGGANPMHFNGRQRDCFGFPDGLFTRLSLTGACYVDTAPTCEADFNRDGFADSQDFFDFLVAFFSGCP